MATENKILGQTKPVLDTLTEMYRVPAGRQANINIFVTNVSNVDDNIKIALGDEIEGGLVDNKCYIVCATYGDIVQQKHTLKLTGICLNSMDCVNVYSQWGLSTFTITGIEYS